MAIEDPPCRSRRCCISRWLRLFVRLKNHPRYLTLFGYCWLATLPTHLSVKGPLWIARFCDPELPFGGFIRLQGEKIAYVCMVSRKSFVSVVKITFDKAGLGSKSMKRVFLPHEKRYMFQLEMTPSLKHTWQWKLPFWMVFTRQNRDIPIAMLVWGRW